MPAEIGGVSEDAVLGGRLILRQPLRGHRVGHDAILLAAATAAEPGERAVDLGAGVGAAGLALARRIDGVAVTLVEIDPELTKLARQNAVRNGLAERVRAICLDIEAPAAAFADAGLVPNSVDRVLMNPPFNAGQNPSPDRGRRVAHVAGAETLRVWVRTAARLLRPDGVLTLIWRADGLGDVLSALGDEFRCDCRAADPPETRPAGHSRARARRQSKPSAAFAAARFCARRCRWKPERRSRSGAARGRGLALDRELNAPLLSA